MSHIVAAIRPPLGCPCLSSKYVHAIKDAFYLSILLTWLTELEIPPAFRSEILRRDKRRIDEKH